MGWRWVAYAWIGLVGCGPVVGVAEGGGSDSGNDPTEPATTIATSVATTSPTTTIDPTTTTSTSTTTSDTSTTTEVVDDGNCEETCGCCNFLCDDCPNLTDPPWPICDLFAQDCPPDEKCMPWANDGGAVWTDVRCSPILDRPKQVGETCHVEGWNASGIDDCDHGLMCLWVDAAWKVGTCAAFCQGSADSPSCADALLHCTIELEGVMPLCLPTCDPLLQDCPVGGGCYRDNGDGFVCGDTIEPSITLGEACESDWQCNAGSLCVTSRTLTGCAADSCCAAICDTTLPDPCGADHTCIAFSEGATAGYCA
jgi:hypothetical protein